MTDYAGITSALTRANSSNNTSSSTDTSGVNASSNSRTTSSTASKAIGKDSFLQLLVAQITNMDPTQDQDSTAYVTQLAEFSSMEQLYNLNQTMTTFAYQNLIGKGATVEQNNTQYTGVIRGVSIDGSGNYSLALEINNNGANEIKVFPADKLVSVLDSSDNSTNNEILLNSAFSTASALADRNQKILLNDTDEDGNAIYVKGTVQGAFIENGDVKLRVQTLNSDGTAGAIKVYPYSSIYKAGDLTEEDMNVTPPETNAGTGAAGGTGSGNASAGTGAAGGTDSGNASAGTGAAGSADSGNASAGTAGSDNTNVETESINSIDSASNAAGNIAASENTTGNSDTEINQRDIENENSILHSILRG